MAPTVQSFRGNFQQKKTTLKLCKWPTHLFNCLYAGGQALGTRPGHRTSEAARFVFVELQFGWPHSRCLLTRFGAKDLFIELWFRCHGNMLEARVAGELFLGLCCNVRLIGPVSVSSKPD